MTKKDEFFNKVSYLANHCDINITKNVYYAVVRAISQELRKSGIVNMPDWGKFYIHNSVPRQMKQIRTGAIINLGEKKIVKFEPDYKVKAYFKEL